MSVQKQVPEDAPVMKAWTRYKHSDEYQNSRRWAQFPQHVDGSMWAAFYAGFQAGVEGRESGAESPKPERQPGVSAEEKQA